MKDGDRVLVGLDIDGFEKDFRKAYEDAGGPEPPTRDALAQQYGAALAAFEYFVANAKEAGAHPLLVLVAAASHLEGQRMARERNPSKASNAVSAILASAIKHTKAMSPGSLPADARGPEFA